MMIICYSLSGSGSSSLSSCEVDGRRGGSGLAVSGVVEAEKAEEAEGEAGEAGTLSVT